MPLHLHRAEGTDLLADGLGRLLVEPLADPFAEELVLVPAAGVQRWLSQRLSQMLGTGAGPGSADGVCAGVAFRNPATLIAEVTGTADEDPWSPEALVWPLLEVIDASCDEPWCATLARHLGHGGTGPEAELRRGRRYAVARRLAGLFTSYARQRPRLLTDWLDGRAGDGTGGDLATDLGWQPPLWRALVTAVGADPPHVRHERTVARLRESPTDKLPARLSLFGHTRLAVTDIELLAALATHHELHLWLPHPSEALWQALSGIHGAVSRFADTSRRQAGHPLLQTLGRDVRELQRALPADPATDEYLGGAAASGRLLGWLQSDIAANAVRPQGRTLADGDRSVQVHSCHGPARQVDVLREVVLGLLEDDPTLQPRDIAVMCPDIEAYAPLITANFGLGELAADMHPAHRLRVRLADRSPMQINPLLGVVAELLGLADSRATASQVLNLTQAAPVRTRFAFTDDDLETINRWVRGANIRWGFDAEHRQPYGLDHIRHNTWRFGLDRILTGVAMSDDSQAWLDTALPLDDVGSDRVELAGRLAEFVDRLASVTGTLCGTRPLAEWVDAVRDGVETLTQVGPDEDWQSCQLQRVLTKVCQDSGSRSATPLRLPDFRSLLGGHLAGRPSRANFRTGGLTVCTMVPMRSIPHRVVCLVGLDDGAFPRLDHVDGDDALARAPMTGDHDARSQDRQLLLDAIGAAGEALVITYTGVDDHTGHRRPPAVPLAELLDTVDRSTTAPVRNQVVTEHPLQSFDIRNVESGALVAGTPFTFDPAALAVARAATGQRHDPGPLLPGALPAPPPGDVTLTDLLDFFRNPVKGFFTALDYALPKDLDRVADAMPVTIDGLTKWHVGERILQNILTGMNPETAVAAECRRGVLPPARLGHRAACDLRDNAGDLADEARRYRQCEPESHDLTVDLGNGRQLTGTVSHVYAGGIVRATYSKNDCKRLLPAWIQLVALAAQHPQRGWTAACIGRGQADGSAAHRMLVAPADPVSVLRDLVALYDAGRREPLPLPLRTSHAWAEARACAGDPHTAASKQWKTSFQPPKEDREPAHEQAWGKDAELDAILGTPRAGEKTAGETTRLGSLAGRLWQPLLDAERKPG